MEKKCEKEFNNDCECDLCKRWVKEITKETLEEHKGHKLNIVTYGDPAQNISLECEDCNSILIDFDY